jgi:hypothetical protein
MEATTHRAWEHAWAMHDISLEANLESPTENLRSLLLGDLVHIPLDLRILHIKISVPLKALCKEAATRRMAN